MSIVDRITILIFGLAAVIGVSVVTGQPIKRLKVGGVEAEYDPPERPTSNRGDDNRQARIDAEEKAVKEERARIQAEHATELANQRRIAAEQESSRWRAEMASREAIQPGLPPPSQPAPYEAESGPIALEPIEIVGRRPSDDGWEPVLRRRPPDGFPSWSGTQNHYDDAPFVYRRRFTVEPETYGSPSAPDTARANLPPSCINAPLGQPIEMCPLH